MTKTKKQPPKPIPGWRVEYDSSSNRVAEYPEGFFVPVVSAARMPTLGLYDSGGALVGISEPAYDKHSNQWTGFKAVDDVMSGDKHPILGAVLSKKDVGNITLPPGRMPVPVYKPRAKKATKEEGK